MISTRQAIVDLFIVVPDPVGNRRHARTSCVGCSQAPRLAVDPWIMGRQEFEETRNIVGGLAYPATHEGRLVYESPEEIVRDLVRQWLRHAEEDFQVAQELMERDRLSYNPVGFHAQQAAEKFIKALLTRYGVAFPKTHSIRILLELAMPALPDLYDRLQTAPRPHSLRGEIRYPGEDPKLNREDGARPCGWRANVANRGSEPAQRLPERRNAS